MRQPIGIPPCNRSLAVVAPYPGPAQSRDRKRAIRALVLLLVPLAAAFPQQKTTFEDRPAVMLANDKLSVTVMSYGGAFAEILLADDPVKLNPLWQPTRMAREAGQPAKLGGGTGHFVCVDGFGPVSAEERAAGMPGHGEAHAVPWDLAFSGKEGKLATLRFTSKLPLVQELFTRTLRMVDGENVVYVESRLENLLAFDRPICWAEHATIGSPFLEPFATVIDMPAARCRTRPYDETEKRATPRHLASGKDFTWPMAPTRDGGKTDERAAPSDPKLDHFTCLLEPARSLVWVTALNTQKNLLLGYIFRREEFPWLQSWEQYPATNRMARGIEFSTQPFDVPRREVISLNSMFEAPVYRWLPAKGRLDARFLIFYARTPEGMKKIDDVRIENGQIVIEDRKARKQLTLAASLGL